MGSRSAGNEASVEWAGGARGQEMYLPLWLRLYRATVTGHLNVSLVVGG